MTIDEFIALILQSPQHRHLYHFTDVSNFRSIDDRGLLSKANMRSEGLWPPKKSGGNRWSHELDISRGIDDDVSLCFTCNHPMKYSAYMDGRLPNPRYLKISPCVLKFSGVRIASGIANANTTKILPLEEAIEELDIEVIYSRTNWSDAEINQRLTVAEKFEVLIPKAVPRNLIKGVM